MNYRSIRDLDAALKAWLPRLPRDIEVVAGVPRSGLLAANLVALHLNRPLTDVDGLVAGRLLGSGPRGAPANPGAFLAESRSVLVLDDSVLTGGEMARTRAKLEAARLPHRFTFAAVYVSSQGRGLVDLHCETVEPPRCFEWNVMHHTGMRNWCVDLDGVLCLDPSDEQNDDGPRYREFLESAAPLHLPSYEIGWIVTCRLERYRDATRAWLERHGVRWNNLVMLDMPSAEARRAASPHARFKADVYRRTGARLFIESSAAQSEAIARAAGRPVLCLETGRMVQPSLHSRARRAAFDRARSLMDRIRRAFA